MEAELNAIVDQGCTVVDVIVEHPLYGQLTGPLQLSSRYDVQQFLKRCASADAQPLSNLTEGIHLHTLSCPDSEAFRSTPACCRSGRPTCGNWASCCPTRTLDGSGQLPP